MCEGNHHGWEHGHGHHGGSCGCGGGHHEQAETCDCGCGGPGGSHGHEAGSCGCHDSHDCGCGGHGHGFQRRYQTKEERIAELEAYLRELEAEAQGVREAIAELRGA
jgi:hypothetical protein